MYGRWIEPKSRTFEVVTTTIASPFRCIVHQNDDFVFVEHVAAREPQRVDIHGIALLSNIQNCLRVEPQIRGYRRTVRISSESFLPEDDAVVGLFTAVVVEDTVNIVAQLQAPESTLSKLAVGLPVNICCSAFGDRIFPAHIIEIGTQAVSTGGLLGNSKTYIDVTAAIDTTEVLMSGLTVRGTIFFVAYDDAILIPHEAIIADENGNEYVYRCIDGVAYKTPILSLYETDDGVVSGGGISLEDVLIKHPSANLVHGSLVTTLEEDTEVAS